MSINEFPSKIMYEAFKVLVIYDKPFHAWNFAKESSAKQSNSIYYNTVSLIFLIMKFALLDSF